MPIPRLANSTFAFLIVAAQGLLLADDAPRRAPGKIADNPYRLADAASPKLLDGIRDLQQQENSPRGETRDEKIKEFVLIQEAVIDAAERILSDSKAEAHDAAEALTAMILALGYEKQLDVATAKTRLAAVIDKYQRDPRPEIAEIAQFASIKQRIPSMAEASANARATLLRELENYLDQHPVTENSLAVALEAAQTLETVDPKQSAAMFHRLAKLVAANSSPAIRQFAAKFEGAARRIDLPGNFMEVEGTTVAGKPLDWSKYRGKVVLVDFWATWCGPCVEEVPNIQKYYKRYHAAGFDVVGVSLDENRVALEEFLKAKQIPWSTLWERQQASGGENPLAMRYDIEVLPSTFLVDKQGKVVAINVRGDRLGRELEKLLGPAKEPADND